MAHKYAVIMAGGYGERFWPLSTSSKPKQLLDLVGDKPLIAQAIERINKIISYKNILIITNKDLVKPIKKIIPKIPEENIIGEPLSKDTATAITLAAAIIKNKDPNSVFCVLTADHIIDDVDVFNDTINDSLELASKNDILITIGIKPSYPATGFGYIKINGYFRNNKNYFNVHSFFEKPDIDQAKKYIKDKSFYWNAGIFIWSVQSLENAFKRFSYKHYQLLNKLHDYAKNNQLFLGMENLYPKQEKISIDYTLMEKADNIILTSAKFLWDDVGSWNSMENHFDQDEYKNTIIGDVEILNSEKNIIYTKDRSIALIGVSNLVVVDSGETILVCKKEDTDQIKLLLNNINSKKTSS